MKKKSLPKFCTFLNTVSPITNTIKNDDFECRDHGLIIIKTPKQNVVIFKKLTCKGTLRHVLLEFIDWRYSQPFKKPSLWFTYPPPLPCVGGGEECWVLSEAIFCRSLTICIWPDSEPTKFIDLPKLKGGHRKINTTFF